MASKYLAAIVVAVLLLATVSAEIHRAKTKPKISQHHRQASQAQDPIKPGHSRETWIMTIISALLVGLSGIFPLLVIPLEAGKALRKGEMAHRLKLLLSFAVGALLGDVFLHLLPEAWKHVPAHDHQAHSRIGLWIIGGILAFLIIEKAFPEPEEDEEEEDEKEIEKEKVEKEKELAKITSSKKIVNGINKSHGKNGFTGDIKQRHKNGVVNGVHQNGVNGKTNGHVASVTANSDKSEEKKTHIKTSGWLNLMANVIDNFTHGLAVAGSYCISTKSGILTTIIILLHEIPHEVGDFAILLRSGFNRWHAAKAQILTASGGLIGALTALSAESAESAGNSTAWILPFTSGGFIYVALVTVVPDLLKEKNPWESLKQLISVGSGIGVMALTALWFDEHDLPSMSWLSDLLPV